MRGRSGAFLLIYAARLIEAVYVLHAFQKKANKPPAFDMELARTILAIGRGSTMRSKTVSHVWSAIKPTPQAAAEMRARSTLMIALRTHIERRHWTQAEAAKRLGVAQPRISNLMRGKTTLFSLGTLVSMANVARLVIEVKVRKAA